MKKVELLAPAGSFETLMTAINAGADAVYFGVGDLNMRASAAINFQISDLKKIADICHENKIRAYITLNTVVYNQELEKIREIIDQVKLYGIDAIIASDLAVIEYARKIGVEVHISTQMSVSNTESVRFFSKFADRIVLARELDLEQVQKIIEDIKKENICGPSGKLVEIEIFAHGAMCVAQSGRCAMSLYHYNLSANRGKCTQVCRRKYQVIDMDTNQELVIDNNFVMSRSDLCTIGMLDKLVASGISVLKIEGRGRGPEYVDTVIRTYKEALTTIENGNYSQEKVTTWLFNLKKVFNRNFSTGYYMGRKIEEWSNGENNMATEKKQLIGQIEHYYPKIGVILMTINNDVEIRQGDQLMITGPTTGTLKGKFEDLLVNDEKSDRAIKGDSITFKVSEKVRVNDKVFLIYSSEKNE